MRVGDISGRYSKLTGTFKNLIWAKLSGGEFAAGGGGVNIFRREPYFLTRGKGVRSRFSSFKCLFHNIFFSIEGSFSFFVGILQSVGVVCSR